jgi:hypothetical protein
MPPRIGRWVMARFEHDMVTWQGKRRRAKFDRPHRRAAPTSFVDQAVADGDVETLLRALRDGRACVCRAASRALARRGFFVPRERLFELFARDRREHVRVQVVRLLARGPRVPSVVSLLWACAVAPKGRVNDAAVAGLRRWGPVWPDVPAHEVYELAAALSAASAALPADLADGLWTYVTFRTGLERRRCLEIAGPDAEVPETAPNVPAADALRTSWALRVVRRRYELAPRPFARLRAMWPRRRRW